MLILLLGISQMGTFWSGASLAYYCIDWSHLGRKNIGKT